MARCFLVGDFREINRMMSAYSMTLNDRRFHFVWAALAAFLLGGVFARAQTIGFVPGNPSVNENGSNVTLVVTRSPATGNSTVDFASRDQTATAVDAFGALPSSSFVSAAVGA